MNDSYFINTNILVYCYTDDDPVKRQKALTIVSNGNTFISTQVLTELSNTLKKKFKLDWRTIENVISEVTSNFNVFVNKPACLHSEST